ncbi:MAG: acyl-CoA dehydrogenase [Bacteroidota bacterium]
MTEQSLSTYPLKELPQYQSALSLEQFMGESNTKEGLFSFRQIMQEDEDEAYPLSTFQALNEWGFPHYYVPGHLGGRFRQAEESAFLMRLVARRNLTLAITHGASLVGIMPMWISGSEEQQLKAAEEIKAGKRFAIGLSERFHGSDIAANDFTAEEAAATEFMVSGQKWLINHAIRGEYITMLSRTDQKHVMRDYSLMLIDKSQYDESHFEFERIKTVGLRGLDLGGIEVKNLPLSADCMIGRRGIGLETIIKALQVTRFMCVIFSLGAADTALRTSIQFLGQRKLYNGYAIDIPIVRQKIVHHTADLLCCEAFSMVGSRMLHVLPKEFSLVSAIAKGVLPDMVDELIHESGLLFGARALLREEFNFGIFQKMKRDHSIISVFDGNTAVNLQYLIGQMRPIAKKEIGDYEATVAMSKKIFCLDQQLSDLTFDRLSLFSRRKDFLKDALWAADQTLSVSNDPDDIQLRELTQSFIRSWEQLDRDILADDANIANTYTIPPHYFEFAKTFSLLHVASACINLWIYNAEKRGGALFQAHWMTNALKRLLTHMGHPLKDWDEEAEKQALGEVKEMVQQSQLISIIPFTVK